MIRKTVLVLAVVFSAATPSFSQLPIPLPIPLPLPSAEGTPEDRAACEGDVRRYCQSAIPDNLRVLGCLQQNRQRISPSCRGVLTKYGQ
jgi:hypothetical protein